MPIYQGKQVTAARPAKQGDKGFDVNAPKTVITLPDGSEKTVPAAEVSEE